MALKKEMGVIHSDTAAFPPLPCICCGKELESAMGDGANNQPYAGTVFHSYGHYGSTIFDPMDGSFIELNVCDDCLKERASLRRVAFKKVPRSHSVPYKYWDPETDD